MFDLLIAIPQLELGPITQGIVNLASDKTKVTNQAGDKACHPLYFVPGNIKKDVRGKYWQILALLPVVKWKNNKKHHGILNARMFHKCLDIVLKSLKACSHVPKKMVDPYAAQRDVCTVLGAYQADTPEQKMAACVGGSHSPTSMAVHADLGNAEPSAPRLGSRTLQLIAGLVEICDVNDLSHYGNQARKLGLNGVYKPFWRDWKFAEPHIFLAPDALHFWHKFTWDHLLGWCRILLGDKEFDLRLTMLQKIIGERHFPDGVTEFSQHTAREARDVAKKFLAVIAGHPSITDGVMKSIRSMIDFIYLAQYESHSTDTLHYLDKALRKFHRNKHSLSEAGVRDGPRKKGEFKIQKLERMWQVGQSCMELGPSYQFSTETNERDHKRFIKATYARTNKKDFQRQMCRSLDRFEKRIFFGDLLKHQGHTPSNSKPCHDTKANGPADTPAVWRAWPRFAPLPRVKDLFKQSSAVSSTTAFQLNKTPAWSNRPVDIVATQFGIPELRSALADYHSSSTPHDRGWIRKASNSSYLPYENLEVWNGVRIQNKAERDGVTLLPPRTLQALPPDADMEFGRRHFALFHRPRGIPVDGIQSK